MKRIQEKIMTPSPYFYFKFLIYHILAKFLKWNNELKPDRYRCLNLRLQAIVLYTPLQ